MHMQLTMSTELFWYLIAVKSAKLKQENVYSVQIQCFDTAAVFLIGHLFMEIKMKVRGTWVSANSSAGCQCLNFSPTDWSKFN